MKWLGRYIRADWYRGSGTTPNGGHCWGRLGCPLSAIFRQGSPQKKLSSASLARHRRKNEPQMQDAFGVRCQYMSGGVSGDGEATQMTLHLSSAGLWKLKLTLGTYCLSLVGFNRYCFQEL
jgi:hypothetical protein